MPLRLAELGLKKGFDKVPGHHGSHDPATQTDNVHVVILDSLSRREVIVDQTRSGSRHLVGADRGADTTATDGDSAFHRS